MKKTTKTAAAVLLGIVGWNLIVLSPVLAWWWFEILTAWGVSEFLMVFSVLLLGVMLLGTGVAAMFGAAAMFGVKL